VAKRNRNKNKETGNNSTGNKGASFEFSFGEPEPISGSNLSDLLSVTYDPYNKVYTPPLALSGLDTLTRANSIHRRCLNFKSNQMAICFEPNQLVALRDFRRASFELEVFGMAYFEKVFTRAGTISRLIHLPTINMRRTKNGGFKLLVKNGDDIEYQQHEVLMATHYDTGQSIYGVPQWIGTMQDVFLNSEATLFRRRYYKNGSHLGYILYTNDPSIDPAVETALREKIAAGKGAGNFKSMYINIPRGDKDAVQIIPIGDISQKDEFEKIKNISGNDIVIGHGVPAQLAAMAPGVTGGYGNIETEANWFRKSEVAALVQPFEELNEYLPAKKHLIFNFDK
jgi:PBSX family phage portal protein